MERTRVEQGDNRVRRDHGERVWIEQEWSKEQTWSKCEAREERSRGASEHGASVGQLWSKNGGS